MTEKRLQNATTKRLIARVPVFLHKEFRKALVDDGLSIQDWVNQMIENYLDARVVNRNVAVLKGAFKLSNSLATSLKEKVDELKAERLKSIGEAIETCKAALAFNPGDDRSEWLDGAETMIHHLKEIRAKYQK